MGLSDASRHPPGAGGPTGPARLFLALWPPPALATALRACCGAQGAQCIDAARLHLTLHFIGAVQRDRLAALQALLGVPFEPFELCFRGGRRWPRGLLVAEPETLPPGLVALHARLSQALQAAGLRTDRRPFCPHVTLARAATTAADETWQAAQSLCWTAQDDGLFESLPGRYRMLQRYGASGLAPAPVAEAGSARCVGSTSAGDRGAR